jgi:glycosyltransferase involved in cell wall biosynthesis
VKIALVHNAQFPVKTYGGTERVVWWLARGLRELGCEVLLVARPGSDCPYAKVISCDFSQDLLSQIPSADVVHFHVPIAHAPSRPYVVTIHGNGKLGEPFLPNTAFVSRSHAVLHGSLCFVHNGLDPDEYLFEKNKQPYLVFLAKASWRVKNVKGAIRAARRSGRTLEVIGGRRPLFFYRRRIHWQGMLSDEPKKQMIARASGLLFPVIWNEPFGLAVIEALVSGTPVVASRRGSLPELVSSDVGVLADTEAELVQGVERLSEFDPNACRERVLSLFHYRKMAEGYLKMYQKVERGEILNAMSPRATLAPQTLLPLG